MGATLPMSKTEIVLSDIHVPEQDDYAIELVCKIIEFVKPDKGVLAGDILTFTALSTFKKSVNEISFGIQGELDVWDRIWPQFFSASPNTEWHALPGNHELRLESWLMQHQGLEGLRALELKNLLGMTDRNIYWHEYEYQMLPTLGVMHGERVRKWGGASALAELQDVFFQISTITGHTHRLGSTFVTTRSDEGPVGGWENGCLCVKNPSYKKHKRQNWQDGLSIVRHWNRSTFDVTQVVFLGEGRKKKAVVFGEEIRL